MGSAYSHMVFYPPEPPLYGRNMRHLEFIPAGDKSAREVPVLYVEWKGSGGKSTNYTILYSHGNAEDLGMMAEWCEVLSEELEVNVACYDYAGYGQSTPKENKPGEAMCYEDIYSVFTHLVDNKHIPENKILLFGRSLGSGPTTHMASSLYNGSYARRRKSEQKSVTQSADRSSSSSFSFLSCGSSGNGAVECLGVVLQSPIASCLRMVSDKLTILPIDMFDNLKKLPSVGCPVMIAHGDQDEVVPFEHGQRLMRSIEKKGTLFKFLALEGSGHNNIEVVEATAYAYLSELKIFKDHLMT